MYKELNTLGVPDIDYFSLVRKSDNKEVYTSPAYKRDNSETLDIDRIMSTLNFYFERVNSGIEQQMQSPKLTEEQKKDLKKLSVNDYIIKFKKSMPIGYAEHVYWTKEVNLWLKDSNG